MKIFAYSISNLYLKRVSRYFIDPVPHQFMILMFRYRGGMCEVVPAVCHVDGTARQQTASKDENKTWYELINPFKGIIEKALY